MVPVFGTYEEELSDALDRSSLISSSVLKVETVLFASLEADSSPDDVNKIVEIRSLNFARPAPPDSAGWPKEVG